MCRTRRCATPTAAERREQSYRLVTRTLITFALIVILCGPWQAGVIASLVLPPVRYVLAYIGLAAIRAYVVRQTQSYREDLGPAGAVTDPNAPWRQWLDTRCHSCGS